MTASSLASSSPACRSRHAPEMEIIVAVQQFAAPGGPQTYAITVAEHLARLGHTVTLYARELGEMAQLARSRALNVTGQLHELPERADGVISGVDRSLAVELAARYPDAARIFITHSIEEIHLPPPLDGIVAATVALNDRFEERARACVGAGEIVRMRQPVDMRRFPAGKEPAPRPQRALLLGNYHGGAGSRAHILKDAWSPAGLQWEHVGYPRATLAVAEAVSTVDIVVGYGRSILEAMCCQRPAYVFDLGGGDGWVTPESYERIEANGFSGLAPNPPPDVAALRADLAGYDPDLGRLGRDLIRTHHDARQHAAQLVALLERVSPVPPPAERSALRALAVLSEAHLRAEIAHEHSRAEAKQWFDRAQELNDQLATQALANEARPKALRGGRRHRLATLLARPFELLWALRGRPRRPPP
ncbi:MAG: hypothetical protein QOG15_1468 [Solirubrobacteraceae bacterium]|nr:hypothetical protein [Solirubrobacteraceae bacterium]